MSSFGAGALASRPKASNLDPATLRHHEAWLRGEVDDPPGRPVSGVVALRAGLAVGRCGLRAASMVGEEGPGPWSRPGRWFPVNLWELGVQAGRLLRWARGPSS